MHSAISFTYSYRQTWLPKEKCRRPLFTLLWARLSSKVIASLAVSIPFSTSFKQICHRPNILSIFICTDIFIDLSNATYIYILKLKITQYNYVEQPSDKCSQVLCLQQMLHKNPKMPPCLLTPKNVMGWWV